MAERELISVVAPPRANSDLLGSRWSGSPPKEIADIGTCQTRVPHIKHPGRTLGRIQKPEFRGKCRPKVKRQHTWRPRQREWSLQPRRGGLSSRHRGFAVTFGTCDSQ